MLSVRLLINILTNLILRQFAFASLFVCFTFGVLENASADRFISTNCESPSQICSSGCPNYIDDSNSICTKFNTNNKTGHGDPGLSCRITVANHLSNLKDKLAEDYLHLLPYSKNQLKQLKEGDKESAKALLKTNRFERFYQANLYCKTNKDFSGQVTKTGEKGVRISGTFGIDDVSNCSSSDQPTSFCFSGGSSKPSTETCGGNGITLVSDSCKYSAPQSLEFDMDEVKATKFEKQNPISRFLVYYGGDENNSISKDKIKFQAKYDYCKIEDNTCTETWEKTVCDEYRCWTEQYPQTVSYKKEISSSSSPVFKPKIDLKFTNGTTSTPTVKIHFSSGNYNTTEDTFISDKNTVTAGVSLEGVSNAEIDSVTWDTGSVKKLTTTTDSKQILIGLTNLGECKNNTIKATVKLKTNKSYSVTKTIKTRPSYTVKLKSYNDCPTFVDLKNYYLLKKVGDTQKALKKYNKINFPGMSKDQYYTSGVPFTGLLNAALHEDGVIEYDNGMVTLPEIKYRRFGKALIIARGYEDNKIKYYGVIDLNDLTKVKLFKISTTEDTDTKDINATEEKENTCADRTTDEEVVFQIVAAGKKLDDSEASNPKDVRKNYLKFIPTIEKKSKPSPFDMLIPLVNDSCVDLFTTAIPKISTGTGDEKTEKDLPESLKTLKTCMHSRPYKTSNLKDGDIRLNVLYMTPESDESQYPIELLKNPKETPCDYSSDESQTECWKLNAKDFGQKDEKKMYQSHSKCRYKKNCDRYGCDTAYHENCNVVERDECSANLAIRFSGYTQMRMAALGCAIKYNKSGEEVTATLLNQGILPYKEDNQTRIDKKKERFGGSKPKSKYDKSLVGTINYTKSDGTTATEESPGYACIPCRFATQTYKDETYNGVSLSETTRKIPIEPSGKAGKLPIFSFEKEKAPTSCIKKINMKVRYFGSSNCGKDADTAEDDETSTNKQKKSDFCSSGNLGNITCGETSNTNVAGEFTVNVCPGAGFAFDNISTSWSPLILDIAGNGIRISRQFNHSVNFDMKGNGIKIPVDWPLNTSEVAFLVQKNKNNKVESIKELFGDYKAVNGFEALRRLDLNKDGFIDKNDKKYNKLFLWFDLNRNGIAEDNEISSLTEEGVERISLNYTKPLTKGIAGKTLSTVYFNSKTQRFQNIEDHYFYEYGENGKKKNEKK